MAKAKKTSKKTKAKKLAKLAPPHDKVISAGVTGATKSKNKKVVKESTLLTNFIMCIAEEKYAQANKYLQQVIHSKLETKIAQSIKPTLF
jgi:hypothetical protein